MDYVFISGLAFYLYQWECIGEVETNVSELIDKVCVSFFFLSVSKHFVSALWCSFGPNMVNKQIGYGKRSA